MEFAVPRFSDARDPIRSLIGEELGAKLPPIWGLNEEGELNGTWRELGVPNLWYMMGTCQNIRRIHRVLTFCFDSRQSCVVQVLLEACCPS